MHRLWPESSVITKDAGMKKKVKLENTLGMFDLLKGVGMLLIVLTHNTSVFPDLLENGLSMEKEAISGAGPLFLAGKILLLVVYALLVTFGIALMPAFLSIGGYGFRKRPIGKGFRLLSKEMLIPYIYTVIATTICNIILHYSFFRYLPGALNESLKVFIGMALGVSETITLGGYTIYANGPVWYVLAFFWAIALFNAILNLAKEKQIPYAVFIVSVIGWLLSYLPFTPLCLSQGMVGVIYVYMGYVVKKKKLISRDFTLKEKLLTVFLIIIPNIVMCSFGLITEMADNVYSLGPITIIENGLMGIVFTYFFLRLNAFRGKITGAVRIIGRYSLYIMCVHSVEMIAVPWYKVSELFASNHLLGFCAIYITRLVIIFITVFLIIKITGRIKMIRDKNREK